MLLLLLLQVLLDWTHRPEFAVMDLTDGLTDLSRPAVSPDMPLDAANQHVYAVTATRVSLSSTCIFIHLYLATHYAVHLHRKFAGQSAR